MLHYLQSKTHPFPKRTSLAFLRCLRRYLTLLNPRHKSARNMLCQKTMGILWKGSRKNMEILLSRNSIKIMFFKDQANGMYQQVCIPCRDSLLIIRLYVFSL